MKQHWRPSLGFVLFGALAGTLALSFIGLILLRYAGPEIGFKNTAALIAIAIALITGVVGWLLLRLLLRPVHALQDYAACVVAGEANAAIPEHFGTQELHAMGRSVTAMAEVLSDRERSLRSYSDHVTHELKTPVAAVRAAAELMQDGGALGAEDRALLSQISGAAQEAEQHLAALREVARARETRHAGETRLSALSDWMRESFANLEVEIIGDGVLPMAASGLRVVLGHLLSNAREHGAGRVWLSLEAGDLIVEDDGPGISEGNRERIFEPFFTTKRGQGGSGMGLVILRNLMEGHGGSIALEPLARGARFRLGFGQR